MNGVVNCTVRKRDAPNYVPLKNPDNNAISVGDAFNHVELSDN